MKNFILFAVMITASFGILAQQPLASDEELIRQGRELVRRNSVKIDAATSAGVKPSLNVDLNSPLLKNSQYLPGVQKDFIDLATGKKRPSQIAAKKYDFMVFVSFSMPDEVLQQYSKQAREYGAKLVIRGMHKNSLPETKRRGYEVNSAGAEWDIAPAAFKKFKIDRVPAIVIADASEESVLENGCAKEGDFIRVDGDVSLHHALVLMKQQGEGKMAKAVELFLDLENR